MKTTIRHIEEKYFDMLFLFLKHMEYSENFHRLQRSTLFEGKDRLDGNTLNFYYNRGTYVIATHNGVDPEVWAPFFAKLDIILSLLYDGRKLYTLDEYTIKVRKEDKYLYLFTDMSNLGYTLRNNNYILESGPNLIADIDTIHQCLGIGLKEA